MSEAICQLVLNSCDALGEQGTISIDVKNIEINGKVYISIDITDDGVGIPEEIRDKVFDPFFSTRRSEGRVGLGLSVVHNIVRKHDGYISIVPCNKGTRINIILPTTKKKINSISSSSTGAQKSVAVVSVDQRTNSFLRGQLLEKNIDVKIFNTIKSLFSDINNNSRTYEVLIVDTDLVGPDINSFYVKLCDIGNANNIIFLADQNQLNSVVYSKIVSKGCRVRTKPCDENDLVDILLCQTDQRSAS